MDLPLILNVLLTLAVIVLVGVCISVAFQLKQTLVSADRLFHNLNDQIEPVSSNLVTSLSQLNKELARVDEVVSSLQAMSERVQITMEIAREAIASPLVKVASFSAGTREAFKKFISRD